MSNPQLDWSVVEEILQLHAQCKRVEDMNMYISIPLAIDDIEYILLHYNLCPIKQCKISLQDCIDKHFIYWMDFIELRRLLLRSTIAEIYYWEYISAWLFKPKQFYDLANVKSYRDLLYNDNSFI